MVLTGKILDIDKIWTLVYHIWRYHLPFPSRESEARGCGGMIAMWKMKETREIFVSSAAKPWEAIHPPYKTLGIIQMVRGPIYESFLMTLGTKILILRKLMAILGIPYFQSQ